MLAEFMWLLGGCGEIKSAARLDLMYEHLTDEAAEDDDGADAWPDVDASAVARTADTSASRE